MERGVKLDKWGYKVTTSSQACISAINAYYLQVLSFGRQKCVILEAVAHDKDCALANILAAHFLYASNPSQAASLLEASKSQLEQATLYEKLVFDAISYLMSRDRDDEVACELHSKLLKEFPRDLVSLKRAQLLCFHMGRPDLSLSLVHQVLPQNEEESYVHGMLAFPLLELGHVKDAEEAARRGLEINKQDIWAQHDLCHVFQYECRFIEAVEFMEGCSSSWSSCSSFMLTHNWWHVALCYLEGHAPIERVLEIYDHHMWNELNKTNAVSAEVYINAVALLLRLCVHGKMDIIGNHLKILAECLTDQANWYIDWQLDVLTVWALAKAGEFSKAEDLLNGLENRISRMNKKKQQLKQRGIVLAEALYAYGKGNDKRGLELLGPDFDANDFKMIGASDEQLDVFNEVWYTMLLNAGEAMRAIEVIEKRIKKREGFPFLWRLLEKGYKLANRPEAAKVANEKARALESSVHHCELGVVNIVLGSCLHHFVTPLKFTIPGEVFMTTIGYSNCVGLVPSLLLYPEPTPAWLDQLFQAAPPEVMAILQNQKELHEQSLNPKSTDQPHRGSRTSKPDTLTVELFLHLNGVVGQLFITSGSEPVCVHLEEPGAWDLSKGELWDPSS
ncbi:hypothetical protein VNO77_04189 [Canavalia gladiata]|uniref:Tetratricopeptide repeat protein 38 n=1 Tax=Canavalia gladiata TaxID=3824 RepID=A0AAN9R8U1_CANGL